jgi:hypothetical protein
MMAVTGHRERSKGETGYRWLFFAGGRAWFMRLVVIVLGTGIGVAFYLWYAQQSNDAAPDSLAGYAYAITGTIFLLLATFLYALRRRSYSKQAVGQLSKSLNWHICFGVLGLVFLFLHSFGNFNHRSGTYALCGLVALTLSGMVGRFLDRLVPRLIAGEVHKALTIQGDDRIEIISQKLQAIVAHNSQKLRGFTPIPGARSYPGQNKAGRGRDKSGPYGLVPLPGPISNDFSSGYKDRSLHTPWDLAYISLEATPQELSHEAGQYRFIPDKKSELTYPGALMPGAQEHMSDLQEVERAMQREQIYRYIIRYWRKFHLVLALLTLALMLWHLIYAVQLLLPTVLHW